MIIRIPFPLWTDWVHFMLGVLAGATAIHFPLISVIVSIIFLVWQFSNREPLRKTYDDILEFLAGYPVGIPLGIIIYKLIFRI